jgi:acetyltransferase-like isoleucine patch superfamily enzyme
MLKLAKIIIGVYRFIFESSYNFLILRIFKVKFEEFPMIKGRLFLRNNGTFKIGKNVKINSDLNSNPIGGDRKAIFVVSSDGILVIEDGVGISNSAIICRSSIFIGKNVFIGGGCKIYDSDFHSINLEERLMFIDPGIKSAPICIKSGVFIGSHSIILKGVTIGHNSVVGAGSIVTRDIPPNQVWGGNPVKYIRDI